MEVTVTRKGKAAALTERARQWQRRGEGKGGQQHLEDAKEGLLKRQGYPPGSEAGLSSTIL
jgi:ribosomal protein L44E